MNKKKRILISVSSFLFSLPSLIGILTGCLLVVYYDVAPRGNEFSKSEADSTYYFAYIIMKNGQLLMTSLSFIGILFIFLFGSLLIRFATGKALSTFPQVYCLSVAIVLVIDNIRTFDFHIPSHSWSGFLIYVLQAVSVLAVIIFNRFELKTVREQVQT